MPSSNIPVAEAAQADTGSSLKHSMLMSWFSPFAASFLCTLCFMRTGQADYIKAHAYTLK